MKETTLGLIETYGLVGAVEALDTAAKVSKVRLLSCEFVKGGIVTIIITGDVASVNEAVDASSIAVGKLGVLRNTHVITRAHDSVWNLFQNDSIEEKPEEKNPFYTRDILEVLKVTELRSTARSIKDITLTKKQIKYGKKEELIKAILINNEGGSVINGF